jgi:hypothetical protein
MRLLLSTLITGQSVLLQLHITCHSCSTGNAAEEAQLPVTNHL